MKIVGAILLIMGIICFISVGGYENKAQEAEELPLWTYIAKVTSKSNEITYSDIAEAKEDEIESNLKKAELCEKASWPCTVIGGILLMVGTVNDIKNPKKKVYTCNKCGADVLSDDEFCPACGSALLYRCPYCKELYEDRVGFCRKCGRDLTCMCPECSSLLKEDEKFCHRCGTQVK